MVVQDEARSGYFDLFDRFSALTSVEGASWFSVVTFEHLEVSLHLSVPSRVAERSGLDTGR